MRMSLEQPPPGRRASDSDRERAAAVVQEAHSDGRLDFQELDERLTQIYSAKTELELSTATADLVPISHSSSAPVVTIRASHSAQKREGAWVVPERVVALAEHSSVRLDFTDAAVHRREVQVETNAQHSSVVMIVPQGWSVTVDDVDLSHSSTKNKVTAPQPGGVHLLVTGRVQHSSLTIRHPRKRHWWWPWYRK
ncbi:uncharacterized protein DUF1707 [Kribbella sp. VKM Ac-2527]|uniref:Uncharacterized protein DUF1707 n=2 Tax=Kribbella caucasensis TaxID=2512215 RepID=A0A4R6KJ90_9ACTN|nr:uncharacterized protein DUF1707 [Kribbella sp. VKM Ac-2527]